MFAVSQVHPYKDSISPEHLTGGVGQGESCVSCFTLKYFSLSLDKVLSLCISVFLVFLYRFSLMA